MIQNNVQLEAQSLVEILAESKSAALAGEFDRLPLLGQKIERLMVSLQSDTGQVDAATLQKIRDMARSNTTIAQAIMKGINAASLDVQAIHANAQKLAIYTHSGKIEETQIGQESRIRRM